MIFKETVTKQGVQPAVWYCCGIADVIYRTHGHHLVVTSMTDSHDDRPASLHLKGLAVDFRTRDLAPDTIKAIHGELVNILNPIGFDVVLESNHIHAEWDPKSPAENWQRMEQA